MFEQTFVDGDGKDAKRLDGAAVVRVADVLRSAILILIPLIYTDVLPKAQLTSF